MGAELVVAAIPAPWQVAAAASNTPAVRNDAGIPVDAVYTNNRPFDRLAESLTPRKIPYCNPVAAFRAFPDHHGYSRQDVKLLGEWIRTQQNLDAVLCTHKDLVKLEIDQLGGQPLYALSIGLGFLDEATHLTDLLDKLVAAIP